LGPTLSGEIVIKMADKTVEEIIEVEFFGKIIRPHEIRNPHLRKIMSQNTTLGYNDWSKFSCHTEHAETYSDHREKYHEHTAYADYDAYWNST